ncbi:uncharacterized protein FOMMEDRAFT_59637, partial [Fomitiporia mediterranea MF3/22]|uniref:uncharacterized protein n=1 Tax=Fomitiporia mediterranea (strain MF3/22) TaxID=694068 RepID=UPI0004408028
KKRGSSKVALKAAQQQGQQQISGAWLCKMNECNKRFVREADLKRHQRTSKEHS